MTITNSYSIENDLTCKERRTILFRNWCCCVICDQPQQPTISPIVPFALGGNTHPDNLWILCAKHHEQKANQWPTAWLLECISERDDILTHNQLCDWPDDKQRTIMAGPGWYSPNDGTPPWLLADMQNAIDQCVKPEEIPEWAHTLALLEFFT